MASGGQVEEVRRPDRLMHQTRPTTSSSRRSVRNGSTAGESASCVQRAGADRPGAVVVAGATVDARAPWLGNPVRLGAALVLPRVGLTPWWAFVLVITASVIPFGYVGCLLDAPLIRRAADVSGNPPLRSETVVNALVSLPIRA